MSLCRSGLVRQRCTTRDGHVAPEAAAAVAEV
jgi:hypothetical protein